jgi:hypothetical protein
VSLLIIILALCGGLAFAYRARPAPPGGDLHAEQFPRTPAAGFGRKRIIAITIIAIAFEFATRDTWMSFLDSAVFWSSGGALFLYLDYRLADPRAWILTVRDDGIHMPVPLPLLKERFVAWSNVKSITPRERHVYDRLWGWTFKQAGEWAVVDVDGQPALTLRFPDQTRDRFVETAYRHVNAYRNEHGHEPLAVPTQGAWN